METTDTELKSFEVWLEGYVVSGNSCKAHRLRRKGEDTLWEANTFEEACEKAVRTLRMGKSYYNKEYNTFWSCRFFDNEAGARKSFG